jgi:hypothetical protein
MGGRGFLSKIDFGMFSFNEWYLDVTIQLCLKHFILSLKFFLAQR